MKNNDSKYFVDLVSGQQWGSEYKGAGVMIACMETTYDVLVSVNTDNAGHTVFNKHNGKLIELISRYLPTACVHNKTAKIVIASGTQINEKTLAKEIKEFEKAGVKILDRLYIHDNAGILLEEHVKTEQKMKSINVSGLPHMVLVRHLWEELKELHLLSKKNLVP